MTAAYRRSSAMARASMSSTRSRPQPSRHTGRPGSRRCDDVAPRV